MADDKTSILIVDDLPEKLLVYRSVLEELGQDIVTANSGEEALRQVLKTDFAVILLDVNMPPGMSGFETAHLIRARKRSAHTPIIFLTAFADEVQSAQGYATGAVDYMTTPIVPEILRAKVRVFVELFRMRQQVARQAEEQARRAAAEESARRFAFLAEASRALASSLDFSTTLLALACLAVPDLADLSLVSLGDEGKVGRTVGCWPGASAEEVGLQPWLAERVAAVLATGKQQTVSRAPASAVVPGAGPDFAVASALILPLVARGRTFGTLTLACGPSGRTLRPDDIALAAEVAGRAGVALDNALLVRDIQENDERKDEFLAMLAHELRNPLAPISNAVQILDRCGIEHPTLTWARGVITRQVSHLVRLVDDLLDVSRITRGKIRLQTGPVDVAAAVNTAVETSRPLIVARRHELTVSLPDGPVTVQADPTRLAQVLSNLLNNAAKFTPRGGRVGVAVSLDQGEVAFRVRDNGSGIRADLMPRIFDLFTQADNSLDRAEGGLGIGLTLVKRLVELHGGTVEARSDGEGKGSEFVVRLPHAFARSAEPDRGPAAREAPSGSLRVLIVDDNIDAAESLAALLRLSGHEPRSAYGGPAALEAARSFRPQAILLDLGLPGLDGYEVARRLRADPLTAHCLLVAVSGYSQPEDQARAREAGFNHHLAKPADLAALHRILSLHAEIAGRQREVYSSVATPTS